MAYRKYYRSNGTYRSLSGFSGKQAVNASKAATAQAFVEKKFSNLSGSSFERFASVYGRKHGSSAEQYFRQTYRKWMNGTTRMSAEVYSRMLALIPTILSPQERLDLLELSLPPPEQLVASVSKTEKIEVSQLEHTFRKMALEISQMKFDLAWFVRGVVSEEELAELQQICRHLAAVVFERTVRSIYDDLRLTLAAISNFKGDISNAVYKADLMGLKIPIPERITQIPANFVVTLVQRDSVQIQASIRPIVDRYLADFSVTQITEGEKRSGVYALAISDLQTAIARFNASGENHEISSDVTVSGKAGTAAFSIHYVGINVLRDKKSQATLWLIAQIAIAAIGVFLVFSKGAGMLCPVGIVAIFLIPLILNTYKELERLNLALKKHPRA